MTHRYHDNALLVDLLVAGLQRDGFDIAKLDVSSNGDSDDPFTVVPGTLDAVLSTIDNSTLPTMLPVERAARRRWARCALVAISPLPDERLLGPNWAARPLGTRFIGLPGLVRVAEIGRAVRDAVRAPFVVADPVDRPLPLTRAQVEVLALVAEGLTNSEIAKRRRTTEKAVRHMVGRIAQRLDIGGDDTVNTRVALARFLLTDWQRQPSRVPAEPSDRETSPNGSVAAWPSPSLVR